MAFPNVDAYVQVQLLSCIQLFATLWTVGCQAPLSRDSPGKNTGVSCHFLFQGIFLTQGLNGCLPSPASPALAGRFFTPEHLGSPQSG